jgi:hypothetical protein
MVRIGWLPPADKAWMRSYKPQMAFVTKPLGFRNSQDTFVDFRVRGLRRGRNNRHFGRILSDLLLTTQSLFFCDRI